MKRIIGILSVCAFSFLLSGCFTYSEGERVGTIIKLSRKGLVCKTWEAEMVRGGLVDGSGAISMQTFHVTVENESLLSLVRDAVDRQAEVKIKYREELVTLCRSDSQDYFLTSMEFLARQASNQGNTASGIPNEVISKTRGWLNSESDLNKFWHEKDTILGNKSPAEVWNSGNRALVLSFVDLKKNTLSNTAK